MTEKTKTKAKTRGRDSSGRFAKGNSLSPGRPRRDTEREYLAAFQRALSAEDLEAVTKAILESAKKGNVAACRVIFEYAIGRPAERIAFEPEAEYRVAGRSPLQSMEAGLDRINRRVAELRKAESEKNNEINGETGKNRTTRLSSPRQASKPTRRKS